MSNRTPEETLAAIESQAAADEMDDVLAMTPEERRRELEAAGFDLAASDAKADALHAAAQAPTSGVLKLPGRRALRVVMLLAAVFAIGVLALVLSRRDTHVAHIGPDNSPFPWDAPTRAQREAADLRKQAAAACEAKKVDECMDRLYEARDLDPAGDTSPEANAIRERIEALQREQQVDHGHDHGHGDKPKWP
jgi:hypothetical protein